MGAAVRRSAGRRAAIIIIAAAGFLLVVARAPSHAFAAEAAGEEGGSARQLLNPHDPDNPELCSSCHAAKPPALSFDAITTCVKCHSGNVDNHPVSRHPIGKKPRMSLPSFFPITKNGEMVCYTCHDPHNRLRRPKMLRVDYQTLCASCHVGY